MFANILQEICLKKCTIFNTAVMHISSDLLHELSNEAKEFQSLVMIQAIPHSS